METLIWGLIKLEGVKSNWQYSKVLKMEKSQIGYLKPLEGDLR